MLFSSHHSGNLNGWELEESHHSRLLQTIVYSVTGKMWYLRSCLVWLNIWLSSLSGYWWKSGVGGLELSSSVRCGRSVELIALREVTDSWSPINSVVLRFEWTVNEVSIPEEVSMKLETRKRGSKIFRRRWIRRLGCRKDVCVRAVPRKDSNASPLKTTGQTKVKKTMDQNHQNVIVTTACQTKLFRK